MKKKEMKILITALVIIIMGAIFFNYTNMTGKAISDYTIISVSPKILKAGEDIHIDIKPGLQGTYQEVEFYRTNNDLIIGGSDPNICGGAAKCYEDIIVDYKISEVWDKNNEWDYTITSKDYYARVYDVYSGLWVKAYFTVERAYEAAGPA